MKNQFVNVMAILFVVVAIFCFAVYFDPVAVSNRSRLEDIKTDQAIEQSTALQPWLFFAKVVFIVGASALFISLVAIAVYFLWIRASLVFPKHGLYPQRMANVRLVGASDNDLAAWRLSAAVTGTQRPTAGVRQIMRDSEKVPAVPAGEPMLVLSSTSTLPVDAWIYDSPTSGVLTLGVGESDSGPVRLPFRNLGGLLIGGLQGMGKSEALASLICDIGRQDATGASVKIALADMKGGPDFGAMPKNLALMKYPVAYDELAALDMTSDIFGEMQRRFAMLRESESANIETFNRNGSGKMPYIVFMIDELAALSSPASDRGQVAEMRTMSHQFLSFANKIISQGRAAGIVCVFATQRPSDKVVPTTLRDLMGARLSYRCSTVHASIAVLGQGGAEDLPNKPGRAVLWMGDGLRPVQTYRAGIEEGRFNEFIRVLPRSGVPQPPQRLSQPAQPVATATTIQNGIYTAIDSAEDPGCGQPVATSCQQPRIQGPKRRLTEEEAADARVMWDQGVRGTGMSKNALIREFWGYKDDETLKYLDEALANS